MGVVADRWARSDLPLVDSLLEEYFEQFCRNGRGKAGARYALAALARRFGVWLRVADVFPKAKGALADWGKLEPDVTSEPLCWAAATFMAQHPAGLGAEAGLKAARGPVVQFDAYVRPGELPEFPVPRCLFPRPNAGAATKWAESSRRPRRSRATPRAPGSPRRGCRMRPC
ncbi:unnamed protein product [Prorocentrum cordatum]|uniref:Uncharacterized protein n=1 Tax=Prorocentrum cordatum TaxID=2364126 RepID=A0ABN9T2F2_9DINO|nr:unnamed protein product [Polarella glacialis]